MVFDFRQPQPGLIRCCLVTAALVLTGFAMIKPFCAALVWAGRVFGGF